MTNEELQEELIEVQRQMLLMRNLVKPLGFYQVYFEELPRHRTKQEAFNSVNDIYFELFGEFKYENYESFRVTVYRMISKDKKQK